MNINHHISGRMQHDYLFNSIRAKNRFIKWKWPKNNDQKVSLIMTKYKYNVSKARQALDVLTDQQIVELIEKQEEQQGGVS
jgi:hypothetical protein